MSLSNITDPRSIQSDIDAMSSAVVLISRWFLPLIFLFGIISNTLDIYVFTRPDLRRNPCCMYFLSSSASALIYTVVNIPFRSLQFGYNIDPTIYILALCKTKFFFTFTWRAMTSWFLVLACLDRFLHSSSNAKLRRLSSFKVASYTIPLTFLVINVAYFHVIIFYTINSPPSCTSATRSYALFLGIWHLVAYGIGPPFLMLLFSLLTIQHILHQRVAPVSTTQSNQMNRDSNKDKHLLRMVFVQCLFVGLTTTAYAATQLYTSITFYQSKDHLQLAEDNLLTTIFGAISATGHSTTFFVFVLSSKLFRQQLSRQRQRRP